MHVVIMDPVHGGHHFTYIRKMTPALAALPGTRVTVLISSASAGTDEYAVQIKPLESIAAVRTVLPEVRGLKWDFAKQTVRLLRGVIADHAPDAIYVPSADAMAQVVGVFHMVGRSGWRRGMYGEACMHRGAFAYPRAAVGRAAPTAAVTGALALSPWSRLQIVDHLVHGWIERRGGRLARKSRLLPDPIDVPPVQTKAQGRERLRIPGDGRYVSCAGMLDERKGVDLLLAAFARAHELRLLGPTDRLLLGGRASAGVRALLAGPCAALVRDGRIIAMDRYISDDELGSILAASDVVCTPHPAHVGLSNICLRAVAAGRPVLGSSFGWLGEMVPRFGLGRTCAVRDAEGFARAIAQGLDEGLAFAPTEAIGRLLRFHSTENFGLAWAAGLRERLGLPAAAGQLTWDWVREAAR